jgi:phytoene dehydrogenase-like protein
VTGVTLEDGRCFQAGAVVSTIGPATLFEELMAERGLADAGYPPLRAGWITSMSALEVDLWLVDPTVVPEGRFLCQTGYDPANAYLDLQRSAPEFGAFVCTTLRAGMDASVELSDLPHVSLFAPAPYSRADHWEVPIPARGDVEALSRPAYVELVSDLADRLIASADAFFPELAEGVVESVTRTPLTIEARTGRTGGAFSGWARIPQQGGVLYPGARTTFRNLYLAGVWTARCIPLLGQLESGVAAASMIVDAADG